LDYYHLNISALTEDPRLELLVDKLAVLFQTTEITKSHRVASKVAIVALLQEKKQQAFYCLQKVHILLAHSMTTESFFAVVHGI
jgi:hypothetical protein